MIKNLTEEQLISVNSTAVIDLNKYRKALKVTSSDIEQYKDVKNLCLLGIARGGLPFMTGVSHFSGLRNVSSLQVQMNKSDERADYGEAFLLSKDFDASYDNYILFEDIIYKGKSINQAVQLLKQKNKKYPSVSYEVAASIEERTGKEVRVTVPGHMQRGGSPCPYDRVFASRLGAEAGKLILKGEYGFMVGIKDREIVKVPLEDVAGKLKMLDPEASIIKEAKLLGISFGD